MESSGRGSEGEVVVVVGIVVGFDDFGETIGKREAEGEGEGEGGMTAAVVLLFVVGDCGLTDTV